MAQNTNKGLTAKQLDSLNNKRAALSAYIAKHPYVHPVGRVADWLADSDYRYPISCTILEVQDTMEGEDGIEFAWKYVSKSLRYAAGVVVDLSRLRPAGSVIGKGGTSSGAALFMKVFSSINEVLRRGGIYKNGAVVAHLELAHPDAEAFMAMEASEIPWVKRTLYVSDDPEHPSYLMDSPLLDKVIAGVANGTLWLSKITYDNKGNRVYSNVCNGILLPSRGSCLLSHINLGLCNSRNLVPAFKRGMRFLCKLHKLTGAGRDNYYLPPSEDKQVGLGVIGLANMLARYNVKYSQFVSCLEDFNNQRDSGKAVSLRILTDLGNGKKVSLLVVRLNQAFEAAAKIAKANNMDRAFTVEPTASCSFRAVDTKGYTTSAEISPPICHLKTKTLVRDSSTFGQVEYQYPPNVETAETVGWDVYYRLCKAWQVMMARTGLAHTISFNIWNTRPVDKEFLADWLCSPLRTTYYRMMVEQDYLDKSSITATLSGDMAEMFKKDLFAPVPEDDNDAVEGFCFLSPTDDPQYCEACAG